MCIFFNRNTLSCVSHNQLSTNSRWALQTPVCPQTVCPQWLTICSMCLLCSVNTDVDCCAGVRTAVQLHMFRGFDDLITHTVLVSVTIEVVLNSLTFSSNLHRLYDNRCMCVCVLAVK